MAVGYQDIYDYAPEFAAVPNAIVTKFITYGLTRINATVWGEQADLATILITAHMLKRAGYGNGLAGTGAGGPRGAVTQESVGDLSRSYANPASGSSSSSDSESSLSSTAYGAEFVAIRNTIPVTPLAVIPDDYVCY